MLIVTESQGLSWNEIKKRLSVYYFCDKAWLACYGKEHRMSGQECLRTIDSDRMAATLLLILRKKEIINQPTFEKTYREYKERLKEAA